MRQEFALPGLALPLALDAQILGGGCAFCQKTALSTGRKKGGDGMGYMKTLATEVYASLQSIEMCLEHALECLAEGDDREARGYINDALAEINRQKVK
jgi:hypothetical protein